MGGVPCTSGEGDGGGEGGRRERLRLVGVVAGEEGDWGGSGCFEGVREEEGLGRGGDVSADLGEASFEIAAVAVQQSCCCCCCC
jgi:hypothetical protein